MLFSVRDKSSLKFLGYLNANVSIYVEQVEVVLDNEETVDLFSDFEKNFELQTVTLIRKSVNARYCISFHGMFNKNKHLDSSLVIEDDDVLLLDRFEASPDDIHIIESRDPFEVEFEKYKLDMRKNGWVIGPTLKEISK